MLAALTKKSPNDIELRVTSHPVLCEDEILIKVAYCGICGSDLHAYNHAKGYEFVDHPRILGHEISGTVIEVNDERYQKLIGKQVIVESMNYCGKCENCCNERYSICLNNKVIGLHFDGGMAQYVKTKAKYVRVIEDVPMEIAVLSEPMSVAVHAIKRLDRDITKNDVILVQGPGIIGFFVALLCVERGAKVYISGLRKDFESRLKKFEPFNMIPHVVEDGLIDEKVDVIFECSGSKQAVISMFDQLKKGGSAVVVALYEQESELFLTNLVRNEWMLIPSYGSDPVDYDEAIQVLKKHAAKIKDIINYYPFNQVKRAFEDGLHQEVLKPVLEIDTKST